MVTALQAIWNAAGYPWSVRLKALLPAWVPWARGRLRLTPATEAALLRMSPRQMDRRLQSHKRQLGRRIYGRTKPGTLLKHQIPIQTERWVRSDGTARSCPVVVSSDGRQLSPVPRGTEFLDTPPKHRRWSALP